jgi:alkylhydroperoxidase family enzyme
MAFIEIIESRDAKGLLKEVYEELEGKTKASVANILKVHSLHPEVMKAHLNLYREVMFGPSGLSRSQREMIAVVVSQTNTCDY